MSISPSTQRALLAAPLMDKGTTDRNAEMPPVEIANISLRQLKVFITVARQKSFTRAADEFGLTQSAVSRCIRELEEEIKLRLFDRTTRQVTLTQAGDSLVTRVSPLLEEIEVTLRDSHGARERHRGVVQLSSNSMLSSSLVPSYIAACRAIYPDIAIVLHDKAQSMVLQAVRSGAVDFGIVVEPQDADDLVMEPLFSDVLCAVLPASHALAAHPALDWRDLHQMPLVVLDDESGSRAPLDSALAEYQVQSGVVQELAHSSGVFRMVEAGLGIGIVPALALALPESGQLVMRALQPEVRRSIVLVCRKNRSLRPNAAAIWTQLAGSIGAPDVGRQIKPH